MDENTKLRNDKIVIFLGAGASVDAGYPLMDGFLDTLKRSFPTGSDTFAQRRKDAFETLLAFRTALSSVRNYVSADFDNIETLYSSAELFSLVYPDRPLALGDKVFRGQEIPQQIALAIWEVYRHPPYDEPFQRTHGRHHDLMGQISRLIGQIGQDLRDRIVFITTNYDMLVELAAWRILNGFSYGDIATFTETRSGCKLDVAPRILKLHGSVNWFINDDHHTICDFTIGEWFAENRDTLLWPSVQANNYEIEQGYAPLIVPPTYAKHASCELIEAVWQEAAIALSQAKILAFIGYSFPRTDTFLTHLLHVGLLENHDLRKVVVVNPKTDVGEYVSQGVFNDIFSQKEGRFSFREERFSAGTATSLASDIEISEKSGR